MVHRRLDSSSTEAFPQRLRWERVRHGSCRFHSSLLEVLLPPSLSLDLVGCKSAKLGTIRSSLDAPLLPVLMDVEPQRPGEIRGDGGAPQRPGEVVRGDGERSIGGFPPVLALWPTITKCPCDRDAIVPSRRRYEGNGGRGGSLGDAGATGSFDGSTPGRRWSEDAVTIRSYSWAIGISK